MDEKQLEKLLENYLAEGKKERISMFDQLKGLGTNAQRIVHQLELHQQKDDLSFASIQDHLKGISSRLSALENDGVVTGRHDIAKLQRELDEKIKDEKKLKLSFINAGIGAVVTLIGGLLALLVNYLVHQGK